MCCDKGRYEKSNPEIERDFVVRRAGIEPATLGLKALVS